MLRKIYRQKDIHTYVHINTYTYTYIHTYTLIHTDGRRRRKHTETDRQKQTCTHTLKHTRAQWQTYRETDTCVQTDIHMDTGGSLILYVHLHTTQWEIILSPPLPLSLPSTIRHFLPGRPGQEINGVGVHQVHQLAAVTLIIVIMIIIIIIITTISTTDHHHHHDHHHRGTIIVITATNIVVVNIFTNIIITT